MKQKDLRACKVGKNGKIYIFFDFGTNFDTPLGFLPPQNVKNNLKSPKKKEGVNYD